MIPKKIHYCWLSDNPLPDDVQKCIQTWRQILPDYELVLWDAHKFDVNSVPFVKEACSVKKWAFAADYIRLYAVYTEGGIYLDSDVIVKKSFDEFLVADFFTAMEYHHNEQTEQEAKKLLNEDGSSKIKYTKKNGIGLQAAVFGGVAGHPFLRSCLKYYENRPFILGKNTYDNVILAPDIFAMLAEDYGLKYKDVKQELADNMLILPSSVFAVIPAYATDDSYAIHCCIGSWREIPKISFFKKIVIRIKANRVIRRLCGKN